LVRFFFQLNFTLGASPFSFLFQTAKLKENDAIDPTEAVWAAKLAIGSNINQLANKLAE